VAALIVVAAHGPALTATALCFDDADYLTENPLVQRPGWASAWRFTSEVWQPPTVHGYYQPLNMISLMLDYGMGGRAENPRIFHTTSLALHVANVSLLAILLWMLFGGAMAATIAAIIFGVHPLTVEPIPWISERKTLLAAFFATLCLISYVRFTKTRSRLSFASTTLMLLLALLSKPTVTPLPLVMLMIDWWPLQRLSWKAVCEKSAWFVLAVMSGIVTFVSQTRTYDTLVPGEYPLSRIPLLLCHNLAFYLQKFVWPAGLTPHYPYPDPLSPSNPVVLRYLLVSIALAMFIVASLKWTKAVAACALIFLIAISPTLQIIGFSNVPASDKFAYWPALGLMMILAWVLTIILARRRLGIKTVMIWSLLCAVVVAGVRTTRKQLAYWATSSTLFGRMTQLAPQSYLTWLGLGNAAIEEGGFDEAIKHLGVALSLEPHAADVHIRLGFAFLKTGDPTQATEHFEEALKINPKSAVALNNLATCHQEAGQLDVAVEQLQAAIRIRPEYSLARRNLAILLHKVSRVAESLQEFRDGLALNPDDTTLRYDYAVILAQSNPAAAISEYEVIVKLEPRHRKALNNLAVLLAQKGRHDDAEARLRGLLEAYPDDVQALNNLGVTLQVQGKLTEARTLLEKAVRLQPDYLDARFNLGEVLFEQGEAGEARRKYEEVLLWNPGHAAARARLAAMLKKQSAAATTSAPTP
jgi:tetratricopeptide (TPR) repeat protein